MPKCYNADGSLTKYAFACGYLQTRGRITLSMEHHVMIVKGFQKNGTYVVQGFYKLTEARKFFRKVSK